MAGKIQPLENSAYRDDIDYIREQLVKGVEVPLIADILKDKYGIKVASIERWINKNKYKLIADRELIVSNVRLAKKSQKNQDLNRIERKSFREDVRIENAVAEYGKELVAINRLHAKELKKINLKKIKNNSKGGIGVMQITDTHGNELIDLPHNKFDFNVLSKRLKKYTQESISYFKYKGARKVLLSFTGDLLNSDRRLDELLNQSTNRSKATVIMVHLLKQVILDVRQHFEVDIVSVLGNESRVGKEMTFSTEAFSDNYDFTIVAQLHQMFEFAAIKGVNFLSYDKLEEIVKIEDQYWLFKHNLDKSLNTQKNTQSTIGRHQLSGKKVDFVIGGHIHAHRGSDFSHRSSSMSGSNEYNENALDLQGRASASCFYVKGSERHYQYIDLQHHEDDMYEVLSLLDCYNAKSLSKTKKKTTILQLVV